MSQVLDKQKGLSPFTEAFLSPGLHSAVPTHFELDLHGVLRYGLILQMRPGRKDWVGLHDC